ncbi:TetR/AcrR family transcriptional regulator [Streptomyces sp. NPDC102441]|uniref:TetR/AcrR family transcriptional regulator n=1 Tax=Streptomyces sp. NPDC102441 TaxID=3366176 RepID=UPI00382351B7
MPPTSGDTSASPARPARPLRPDAERNRRIILQAAVEVFTERGLEAGLDDIARHAGVGVGTVYRRFPKKEALIEALFCERMEALVPLAERCLTEQDSWTGLFSFFERLGETLMNDRGLRQVLMSAAYGGDGVAYARNRLGPVVRALFERALADGKLRDDVEATDWPCIEFMLNAVVEYSRSVRPELWRRYLTILFDGLRPQRDTTTPLQEPPLTTAEMEEAARLPLPQRL